MKLLAPRPSTLLKKDSNTQMFSCQICGISKNIYLEEYLRMTASNNAKVKKKILQFHNFLVNAFRVGLICPSLQKTLSMANLPVPLHLLCCWFYSRMGDVRWAQDFIFLFLLFKEMNRQSGLKIFLCRLRDGECALVVRCGGVCNS